MSVNLPAAAGLVGIRDEVVALKRERTIEAAAHLFYDRGYENTSLDAIAERLNVTKPFIYSHFASKTELLAEICARGPASALDALERTLADNPGPPRATLEQVARRTATAILRSQRYMGVFAREEKNLSNDAYIRIRAIQHQFDQKLVGILDEGVAAGEFEVHDTRFTALAITGMMSWAYIWYRSDGRLNVEQLSDGFAALIMNMVAPPARASKPKLSRTARR